jgi:glucuronate isomerase
MDSVLVGWRPDGSVQFENEDWTRPTVQERRAILHAAEEEVAALQELIAALDL